MGKIREDKKLRDRTLVFKDRREAGKSLAEKLENYQDSNAWVLAIPAGGVPIGVEISKKLGLRFDLAIVRKIHIPWNPEAGFGAVSWDGKVLYNKTLLRNLDISETEANNLVEKEKEDIEKRMDLFRDKKPFPDLGEDTVIITDDGLASGFTMLSAVESVKERNPKKLVVTVPTGSETALQRIEPEVDELVCLNIRTGPTFAVAGAYEDCRDLSDEEVEEILEDFRKQEK